jgi:hypothetical protein
MSYDDNRTGFTKRPREDDEGHSKPKFKAKSTMDRPHTVHVDGKAWKKFDNGHQAHAAAKTLEAKGKKATAIAHFKEEAVDESMTDSWKSVQSMDKGSVLSGKDGAKKRLAYLNAVHAHHKKFGNDTKKVKSEIESINRSRVAEEVEQVKEDTLVEGSYEKAEENKRSAEAAKSQARPFDYHMHMADHHDNMSQWHASKGRHGEADRHGEKSDEHHEKAMSLKEATAYYNKPSFLKKMGRVAKQERLAREKKEKEAKPVKEDTDLDEGLKPGWMLKADTNLATKLKAQLDRKKHVLGKPSPGYKPDEPKKKVSEEVKVSTNSYGKKSTREVLNALSGKQDMSPVQQDISPDASKKPVGKVLSALKGKQTMSPVKEEVLDEARVNGREYASHGLMHPDHAKMDIHKVSGQHVDFYASKTGDKMQGKVVKNDGKHVHIQAHSDKEIGDGKLHKFKVQSSLPTQHNEEKQPEGLYSSKRQETDGQRIARLAKEKRQSEKKEKVEEAKKEAAVMCANCGKPYHKGECDGEPEKELKEEEGYTLHSKETNADGTITIILKSPSGKLIRHKGKGAANAVKQRYGIQSGVQEETETLTKEDTMINSFKSYMQEDLDEAAWPGTPEYKAKFPEVKRLAKGEKQKGAKGTITGTGTGVKHERDYEKAEKETGASETQEKRGRGRPKGSASGARQK